ncbi:phosphotransferase [Sanguibacter sp. A247]|uniref:phosphotransferase n=1 Tax=unclassified Sanguibacter TaxID=2645534 RepID=UPI003FD77251
MVVRAESAIAGFTPGLACVLELADGTRLFIKGAGPASPEWLVGSYRREAATVAALPPHSALVPLRWTLDVDGWFFAVYDAVDATHPVRPWTAPDAWRVLDALTEAAAALTPPPAALEAGSWVDELGPYVDQLGALEPRIGSARTAHLQDLARRVLAEAPATTLSHDDVRDDNLLLERGGGVRLVDWSHGMLAPPWFMSVVATISMAADGLDARALLAEHPATRDVHADHVDGLVALHLGYYAGVADLEEVETSPQLRAHQRWYREATIGWFGY